MTMKKQNSGSNKTELQFTLHGILRELFLGRLLSLRGRKSPNLLPCDFFSLGTLRSACVQSSSYNPAGTKGSNHPGSGCHSTGNYTKNYGQLSGLQV
ncbi:hypothetical protein TNCT_652951 [Trichonephila clavata]|uniref:Uncharacterized protein n=1 Tax=Trichonephila clavata TaxID=2740835 RepID=A0A8X6KX02_TRICU|nr:hypothetical protein TNCT_652951 [Trichonephila clavata]